MVVNNAGYAAGGSVEDFPEDEFRAQIEANLFGVVNVTRATLPVLRRRRSGHIVQISSIGGRVGGTPGLSAYQSAKFAVEGFSEALASEVAPLGIEVTIVEPGGIRTGWAAGAATPVGRIGADYEQTVGQWLERFEAYSGNEPGDPARMARRSSTSSTRRTPRVGCCSAATRWTSPWARRKDGSRRPGGPRPLSGSCASPGGCAPEPSP
ncbi:SDR family NAD(P)-dependent oxidoreductase [Streptomyces sp. NPDC005141]